MDTFESSAVSRRAFLQAGAVGAAAILGRGLPSVAAEADPYHGFKMGIQSYSLRGFKVEKALEESKKLGLHYWESTPGHFPITTVPKQIAEELELLKGTDIKLLAYGVLSFDSNETKAREYFDFAKGMGIETLSANPKKDKATFDLLDKLVEEYKINIAIHNHGPKALYDKISDVVEMVKDRHPRVGACVDTGHYLRSKENPVEAIERLKERVYGVHLKDVKNAQHFTILGEGDLDVVGCLKALKRLNYKHGLSLEYEENMENPVSDIEACLRNVRKAFEQIG